MYEVPAGKVLKLPGELKNTKDCGRVTDGQVGWTGKVTEKACWQYGKRSKYLGTAD